MQGILQTLTHSDVGLAEKVVRTIIVYVFLLVGLRLGGKRELGSLNPFDLVVLLVLSNTLQNAIIGPDNSLLGGLIGAATLLVLNYLVVRFLFQHPKLDRYVEGEALELIHEGKLVEANMRREFITRGELESRARIQGLEDLSRVRCARIEVGGALTFVLKTPTPEEQFTREMYERLERLEGTLNAMAVRMGA
jgi:uncharacterized membrane protein YcaP (DUF421 family)